MIQKDKETKPENKVRLKGRQAIIKEIGRERESVKESEKELVI